MENGERRFENEIQTFSKAHINLMMKGNAKPIWGFEKVCISSSNQHIIKLPNQFIFFKTPC